MTDFHYSDFDTDIDERRKVEFLRRLGPAKPQTVKRLSDYRTRGHVWAAVAIFASGLPVALTLRAILG